ncbi:MAG: NYN domain-containing protein [Candidatus Eisenbacteria bacterium]
MPVSPTTAGPQLQIAVFIDFENIALGLRDASAPFEVRRILDRLLEKGKVIVKVAYADWNRFRSHTTSLHENGIELIEIPRRESTGKNSADIRLVVDAMDLSWSKAHIDTFVIVSGDSDFSPLVAKLKENGRHVIGLGMRKSTSPLLANACDEFIYYENLESGAEPAEAGTRPTHDKDGAFRLLADTVRALQRENFDVIQASLVKDTMKRKRPAFSESALGYGSFSELLEDAQETGLITLRTDERSGTYMVTAVASERPVRQRESRAPLSAPVAAIAGTTASSPRPRRRRGARG